MRWLFAKGIFPACFLLLSGVFSFGQAQVGIDGAIEWERMEINAVISLDLASAGIRMPAGRMQGEAILASEYLRLIRPEIMNIQVDSSSSIGDLIGRGEWCLFELESLALQARAVPPALSLGFDRLSAFYTLGIAGISRAFIRHRQPVDIPRTLSPVPAPAFTGIVIIASDVQPIHGRQGSDLIRPALFPKIWDTQMNLIFERNMLNPNAGAMVRYFCRQGIFAGGPTGLSPEVTAVVGERPLRIFARGAFGVTPTDPIISREDALMIISTPENRNLLREGRVAIILDDSVLRSPFMGQ